MGNPISAESVTNNEAEEEFTQYLRRVLRWITHEEKGEWLNEMRGNLSLGASIILTMTFQLAFNPPGGVRPVKDIGNDIPCMHGGKDFYKLCHGEAVLAAVYPDQYFKFFCMVITCFIASAFVFLLLVSGIPLNQKFPVWLLSVGMYVALTSLSLTLIMGVTMMTPNPVWSTAFDFMIKLIYTWVGFLSFLALFHTLRLVMWVMNSFVKRNKITKTSTTPKSTRETLTV